MFVDFQLQRGNLRQHDIGEPGFHQRLHSGARPGRQQHFDQFVAYALGGDDADTLGHFGDRLRGLRLDAKSQLGDETNRAHHAQRIVIKGLTRIDGRAQHALGQVVRAAERIDELQIRYAQRHGVHREIAPRQIPFQRIAVIDFRFARIRIIRVASVRGHLDLYRRAVRPAAHGAERAEFAAHIPETVVSPCPQDMFKLLRPGRRAEIKVVGFAMQQQVTYRTSHESQLIAFIREHMTQLYRFWPDFEIQRAPFRFSTSYASKHTVTPPAHWFE